MNEKQVINKLRLLKTLKPTQPVLENMKQNIYQQVKAENERKTLFDFRELFGSISMRFKLDSMSSYGLGFALVLIIFLSISSFIFPTQLHTMILYGRLDSATNQYQKATIALADTTTRFGDNKEIGGNTQEFSQSLALTNAQLNNLKLKGEKGKYTAQQCHQIYQKYLSYLEKEEKNISTSNSAVKSQINTYEEQAEKKLHMYTSL